MADECHFIDYEQEKICIEFSENAKERDRCIICIHGGPGGTKEGPSDLFLKFKPRMEQLGYTVVRFDMIGTGDSTGNYRTMTVRDQSLQLSRVISFAKKCDLGQISLVAESMGATVALMNWPSEVKRAALLWPALDLMDTDLTEYLEGEHKKRLEKEGFTLEGDIQIGKEFVEEFQSMGSLENTISAIKCPLIFIHGDSDSSVPHAQSQRAHKLANVEKKLVIVPGGDHCLRDQQEQVIDELYHWFCENKQ